MFSPLLLLFSRYHSSRQRLGTHGTTAAPQAFPFVTATNSASAYGFVSVRACHCRIRCRNQERSFKNIGAIQRVLMLSFIVALQSAVSCCVPVSRSKFLTLWQPRYNRIVVVECLRFVTVTNGASLCACVRNMWSCHPEHNEGQYSAPQNSY